MASTTEMIRLMRHAAERLGNEETAVRRAFNAQLHAASNGYTRSAACNGLASYTAASTLARTVLRIVAAAMDDEPAPDEQDALDDAQQDVIDAAIAWRQVEEGDDRDAIRAAAHTLGQAVDALDAQEGKDGEPL